MNVSAVPNWRKSVQPVWIERMVNNIYLPIRSSRLLCPLVLADRSRQLKMMSGNKVALLVDTFMVSA
jgi:hypothetical protein